MPGRVTREQIAERYPALLHALRNHPGIGFVLVRGTDDGALVLGARGERRLSDGAVSGEDPLAPFGGDTPRATSRRTDGFPHCPDILVNSTYWPEIDEVAAFEELVGSHGGLGGPQIVPVSARPAASAGPTSRSSARRRCTACCAAGWRISATPAIGMRRRPDRSSR